MKWKKEMILLLMVCFIALFVLVGVLYKNNMLNLGGNENQEILSTNTASNQIAADATENSLAVQAQKKSNTLLDKSDVEHQPDLVDNNMTLAERRENAEQYEQNVIEAEEARQILAATQEVLLNSKQTLNQLNAEWERHANQLGEYQNAEQSARAAANYETINIEETEALLNQLIQQENNNKPDYPAGMAPQVVDRVQQTTGISSTEIENLMNQ